MSEREYSQEIAEAIRSDLDELGWSYSFDENRGIFRFGVTLQSKIKNVQYVIYVNESEYTVYVISPIGADENDKKMLRVMAEFVCRANYGLKNGCFELDMNDGELRYKSYVDCEGGIPSSAVIENSIHCPAAMFRRYSDGILAIIFGATNAKAAVDKCERSTEGGELRELLGDDLEEGDVDGMLSRLRDRLGIDEEDLSDEDDEDDE